MEKIVLCVMAFLYHNHYFFFLAWKPLKTIKKCLIFLSRRCKNGTVETQNPQKINLKTLLQEENDDYRPFKVGHFWNNNYIEYESALLCVLVGERVSNCKLLVIIRE